jgi:hypothetical protein
MTKRVSTSQSIFFFENEKRPAEGSFASKDIEIPTAHLLHHCPVAVSLDSQNPVSKAESLEIVVVLENIADQPMLEAPEEEMSYIDAMVIPIPSAKLRRIS